MNNAVEKIEWHYNKANEIALQEVERLAREVMKQNRFLTEFIMGMGTASFACTPAGQRLYGLREHADPDELAKSIKNPSEEILALDRLFCYWDDHFKLTGTPMRFTATSEKTTDW